jgi:predicted CXXCH cytochrome family protein
VVRPGFKPGDDLFAFNEVNALEDAVRSKPDGRANGLFHNLILVMEAKCGELSCMECHDPHGGGIPGDLYRELEWDGLCTKCHGDLMADIEAHTFHRGDSPGSRCVNCHLAPVVIETGRGTVRDHTISTPSPQNTRKYGLPNACVECHLAEPPGWVEEWFERWWPGAEERNHRTRLCDALFAARNDRPGAKALLEPWAHDPNPVYRAAAVWELGGSGLDLRPWLRDEHALVQRGAIDGVAKTHPEALVPMLNHPNAVLRGAAAEALATKRVRAPFDWMRDRPALREKVLVVLEEMARLRPDRSSMHYLAGVMHELSGRAEPARRSYERYLRLNPYDDRVRLHLKSIQ